MPPMLMSERRRCHCKCNGCVPCLHAVFPTAYQRIQWGYWGWVCVDAIVQLRLAWPLSLPPPNSQVDGVAIGATPAFNSLYSTEMENVCCFILSTRGKPWTEKRCSQRAGALLPPNTTGIGQYDLHHVDSSANVRNPTRRQLVPQFMPWIQQTIQQLLEHSDLPPGSVVVPACGPGIELVHLHKALPHRSIIGVDIAPGMVDEANRSAATAGCSPRYALFPLRGCLLSPNLRLLFFTLLQFLCTVQICSDTTIMHSSVNAIVGDACDLPLPDLQPIAGLLSTFGLQQMPSPAQVRIDQPLNESFPFVFLPHFDSMLVFFL